MKKKKKSVYFQAAPKKNVGFMMLYTEKKKHYISYLLAGNWKYYIGCWLLESSWGNLKRLTCFKTVTFVVVPKQWDNDIRALNLIPRQLWSMLSMCLIPSDFISKALLLLKSVENDTIFHTFSWAYRYSMQNIQNYLTK